MDAAAAGKNYAPVSYSIINFQPTKKITMKKIIAFASIGLALLSATAVHAQGDKSKRPSPPAMVTETLPSGAVVTINYSRPSVKGRTLGKDVEPMTGKVWRMGANEATTFEVSKDVTIEGKKLPAGKYSLFGLLGDKDYTLIFNNAWNIWGTAYDQNKDKDALRVSVKPETVSVPQEQLLYTIDKEGNVSLLWGNLLVKFRVE